MKTSITLIATILILLVASCKKEDSLNQLPSAPVLLEPLNGSVTGTQAVAFKWQESNDAEGDDILYTLNISKDSVEWKTYSTKNNTTISVPPSDFEPGKKYYWKVTTENSFSGSTPEHEEGVSVSEVFYFYTTPPGVSALRDTSGHQFVNLYWTDPENLDHVEITFTPLVASITQPITVNAGIGKVELQGLENATIYRFAVKAINKMGHASVADSIKSMPLLPNQVYDADFNIYTTVTIGTQTWLRENLRTTKWQDGTEMGDFCYKGSKSDIYGLYYNINSQLILKNPCPRGCHVPSDEEWKTFERYLGMPEEDIAHSSSNYIRGGDEKVGFLLKSQTGWADYMGASGNGNDLYGFNALPSGYVGVSNGVYTEYKVGMISIITSSTDIGMFITRGLSSEHNGIDKFYSYGFKSIRCIKD